MGLNVQVTKKTIFKYIIDNIKIYRMCGFGGNFIRFNNNDF